jgi:hypothetical protein
VRRDYFHIALLLLVSVSTASLGQRTFSFGVSSGLLSVIANDQAQPSFNFKGNGMPLRLDFELSGPSLSHNIQFSFATPDLSSSITSAVNGTKDRYMESKFYSLRYACLKEVYRRESLALNLGMTLHSTAFVKTFNGAGMSQTSYEGIIRLAGSASVAKKYLSKGQLNLHLYVPLYSFVVNRGYGLSEQEQQFAGLRELYGVEVDINNHFRIARRTKLLCGYDMLFYECMIGNRATTVVQQFYAGFIFSL